MLADSITLSQSVPLYRQIVLQIEEMVKRGELGPGSRMPSTLDFAKQFKVANQTAQNALKELTNRGILKRVPRKGTFVSENLGADTIAMFCGRNPFTDQHMGFSRLFCAAAFNHAGESGWGLKLYFPHDQDGLFKAVSDLEKDIGDGKIKAVFGLHTDKLDAWFKKSCAVPYVQYERSGTTVSMEDFTCEGLQYLCGRGFSRIALISFDANKRLGKEVGLGLEKARKTIPSAFESELWLAPDCTPGEAKALTHAMLDAKPRLPDALFVVDDNLASGVIFALQERGVKIPRQVALLTLSVKGIELLSPTPLTRLEYDPDEMVRRSLGQLFDKLGGRKPSPHGKYHPSLVVGKSCGE